MRIRDEAVIEAKQLQIIKIAEEIILEKGIDKLSIREIANKLQQTHGIVYHYFRNKDEILFAIVKLGYQEIVQTVSMCAKIVNPVEKLHDTLYVYMKAMIKKGLIFQIMMQSNHSQIQEQVNVLNCDVQNRKSIHMLCQTIQLGIDANLFECSDIEIRAKTIWASVYGLIMRIICEQVDEQLSERLIEDQIRMIIKSLKGDS